MELLAVAVTHQNYMPAIVIKSRKGFPRLITYTEDDSTSDFLALIEIISCTTNSKVTVSCSVHEPRLQ